MNTLLAVFCLSASFAVISAQLPDVDCEAPVLGSNMELTPNPGFYVPGYNMGDIIKIECVKNYLYNTKTQSYIRSNSISLKCAGYNQYSPPFPVGLYICKERVPTCSLSVKPPLDSSPPNKNIFKRGESAYFKCRTGYYLSGVSKIRCEKGGLWSNPIPRCLPFCKKPSQKYLIVNDDKESYMSGGSIHLECEKKYVLTSFARRFCESNGKWDPAIEDNLCKRTGCAPPPPFRKGRYLPGPGDDDWYEEGERITYECLGNYYLEGKEKRLCSRKGVFIYGEPKCIEIRCDKPMEIEKGSYGPVEDDYAVGDSVEYKCIENYRLSTRSGKRSCVRTGDKTAEFEKAPRCIRIECDDPATIKNGIYKPKRTNHYVGDTVKYECDDYFYLFGKETIECQLNADKLTADYEPAPECRPITCDKPMPLDKGSFEPVQDSYRIEDTIDFTCDPNHYRKGPASATCVEDTRTKGKFTAYPECIGKLRNSCLYALQMQC